MEQSFIVKVGPAYESNAVSHKHRLPYFTTRVRWPVEINIHTMTIALSAATNFPAVVQLKIHNMTCPEVIGANGNHYVFVLSSKVSDVEAVYRCVTPPCVTRDYKPEMSFSIDFGLLNEFNSAVLIGAVQAVDMAGKTGAFI
ncbi:hypothetical protein LMBV_005 [Largemouth bass virus]|uniref:Uncharacterized protein n=1 Tax=Largemouth bass virus TaxID=176656 RepID=A0A9X7TN08_9VIRU|nr:hypothetical protein OA88_23260 [Flavobacterium sp. JRM]QJE49068.1 hypothetical protein LMBV_005 [Largemouth bass virus]QJE49154.1 hypothetical protein LMBV_005 [Largemouth bass virus]